MDSRIPELEVLDFTVEDRGVSQTGGGRWRIAIRTAEDEQAIGWSDVVYLYIYNIERERDNIYIERERLNLTEVSDDDW